MIKRWQVHADRWLAGRVLRYHTWPTIQTQTTRDHSARMAEIYVEIFGMPRAEVLYWCLLHDKGEQYAGDMPFGGKSTSPAVKQMVNELEGLGIEKLGFQLPKLTSQEFAYAKICDVLEMYEFCLAEVRLGNTYARVMVNDTRNAAMEKCPQEGFQYVVKWMQQRELGDD